MNYVFVCPGMAFRGDFIEQGKSLGGSESACYYVTKELAANGHNVLVFTMDAKAEGSWDGVDYAFCGPKNETAPLGEYVHAFMEATYIDVLIVQRAPGVHKLPHAAKVAFWWLHDVAIMRALGGIREDNYQYDGVLAVSEWHKSQIADTWKFNPDYINILRNSVDTSLYLGDKKTSLPEGRLNLFYQSRPERGLDYLICPNGIMEKLLKVRPEAHLYVCGYDNTTEQMRAYYDNVFRRIEQLPNCTRLPYMGKKQLAETQKAMDLLVYPGEFEETSCITAMECQAAGLPMVANRCGALPETCDPVGTAMISPKEDGKSDVDAFVSFIEHVDAGNLEEMTKAQLSAASNLSWGNSARDLEGYVAEVLSKKQSNPFSMVRSMIDRSDILLAGKYLETLNDTDKKLVAPEVAEIESCYSFIDDMKSHYDSDKSIAEIDADPNLDLTGSSRFQEIMHHISSSKTAPTHVLDYGCQKGHLLWSMAQVVGGAQYVGMEISPRAVAFAKKHCKIPGTSVTFVQGNALDEDFDADQFGKFDCMIIGEVLEHVVDPVALMKKLEPMMADGCKVVATTPFGDWEGAEFNNLPDNNRYHLHHFERADLNDMFGHHEDYVTSCVPAGRSAREPLGSWVTSFTYRKSCGEVAKPIDFVRKLALFAPRETVSFCAIVKDSESTILRSMLTVKDLADEFIVALDKGTTDRTRAVLEMFKDQHCRYKRFVILDAVSPTEIGFDAARNRTLDRARGNWIMWMDSDEDLIYPERIHKFLRNNQYDGYGIAQNHMSADPVGVLTQDWPVRFFRNVPYMRFVGVVHEHPDDIENENQGPRFPAQIIESHIIHHGYTTEQVRRDRFGRNLPLIRRDRKQNPDRLLGKMLYMRDLSHMCMFEAEQTRGAVTNSMRANAEEGIQLFDELMQAALEKPIAGRMAREGLEFYSNLVSVLGVGFEAELGFHAAKEGGACVENAPRRKGRFLNRKHLESYMKLVVDEQVSIFETKYW